MARSDTDFTSKFDRSAVHYRSWLGDLTDDVEGVLADPTLSDNRVFSNSMFAGSTNPLGTG